MPTERWSRRTLLGTGLAGLGAFGLPRPGRASPECEGPRPQELGLTTTLSNATLVLPTGQVIEGGGIRLKDGIIEEVGGSVKGGQDLGGRWLVPGFIDAGSQVGLWEVGMEGDSRDDGEGLGSVLPDLRVVDGYNPCSEVIPVTRLSGILTTVVLPSGGKLVSGQAAAFRLTGRTVEEALLRAPVGLCINLGRAGQGGDGGPRSRLGVGLELRKLLDGVELPEEDAGAGLQLGGRGKRRRDSGHGDGSKDQAKPDDELSPGDLALRRLRRGELKALVQAERADDILRAAELIRDYELDGVIMGAAEAHLVTRELRERYSDIPLVLGPVTVQPSSFETLHASYGNARAVLDAGLQFSLRSSANHFARGLPTDAAVAVAHGLPWFAALRALTLNPAATFGLPEVGRLDEGVRASFFVTEGDPLQPRHAVHRLVIGGRDVPLESYQTRLFEEFRELR